MKKLYTSIFILIFLLTAQYSEAAVSLLPTPTQKTTLTEDQIKVFYNNNALHISGLSDSNTTIEVYNMLGKRVASYQNIRVTGSFSKNISLPKNNIFIVSVQTESFKKTFKIVTK
ncbi:T9SS type A sorting domain-containing protein [Neptunitalea lumnitzerae]|uniref:Por secretion system C-terminal sorting domain-containing protein n=1 Tax=Neptunitalea lumnitzerae TaxID=2965509 RepID=A0ABQ5MM90_9FLAO|nr:T9SS type A sorting domain-containing protein [Neptunitalea sp. Y10]GLB50499.1 hypothetical protein Y10_28670 [Neptunitalea sp. Y10]